MIGSRSVHLRAAHYSDIFEPRTPHLMGVSAARGVTIFCVPQAHRLRTSRDVLPQLFLFLL